MKESKRLAKRIADLPPDERSIIRTLIERLETGRKTYGTWSLEDGRNNRREALLEVLDALHYCAAELSRLSLGNRVSHDGRPRVYVCHPFSINPEANRGRVQAICRALYESGFLPIAPHLYLPQFIEEETNREGAMEMCLALLGLCDELRVYGGLITQGMQDEMKHADERGIPIRCEEEVEA